RRRDHDATTRGEPGVGLHWRREASRGRTVVSRADDPTIASIASIASGGSTVTEPAGDDDDQRSSTFDHTGDRFALGPELGRGGMGRVFAATDLPLGREVAIKQMLAERPDDLARFEREVRITAQLEHPSIVPIYEAAR